MPSPDDHTAVTTTLADLLSPCAPLPLADPSLISTTLDAVLRGTSRLAWLDPQTQNCAVTEVVRLVLVLDMPHRASAVIECLDGWALTAEIRHDDPALYAELIGESPLAERPQRPPLVR